MFHFINVATGKLKLRSVSHFYRHHCASPVSNNWNDNILVSKKCLCGFGVKGRVAHSNNQLPSYLLVEVSARLQLPEKKASKAATCSQVDGRLLTGIRGCVDGGPGLQQMLQTIHLWVAIEQQHLPPKVEDRSPWESWAVRHSLQTDRLRVSLFS